MKNGRRIGPWLWPGLIVVLGLAIGAYRVGPVAISQARLELLALDDASHFAPEARLLVADTVRSADARYPLILAVRNVGTRAATLRSMRLAVPAWVRLYDPQGDPLPVAEPGEVLAGYAIALESETIEPGAVPLVPAGLDHLWIGTELSPISCELRWDGVPEFAPMPRYDADDLARVVAFYSLEGDGARHTGQLTLGLDPSRIAELTDPVRFEHGEVEVRWAGLELPALARLELDAAGDVTCGAPSNRIVLGSVVWRAERAAPERGGRQGGPAQPAIASAADTMPPKGRWYVVTHGGVPRKLLYDLDGDGRIEYEAWDGEGDGRFEAGRDVSFPVPDFLTPPVLDFELADATSPVVVPVAPAIPPAAGAATPDAAGNGTQARSAGVDSADALRTRASPPTNTETTQRTAEGADRALLQRADSVRAERQRRARADSIRADSVRRARARLDSMVAARMRLDSLRRDSIRRDSIRREVLRRDSIRRDTLRRDTLAGPASGGL